MLENIQAIATLVGSFGFPIVACVYMATSFNKTMVEVRDLIQLCVNLNNQILDKLKEVSGNE